MFGNERQSILIIDDSLLNISILSKILVSEYDVKLATSGEDGLAKAVMYTPDIILLDIIMSGISGFEVLKRLRSSKETAFIPVIFITGMNSAESEVEGLAAGAADYITKPFNESVVKQRVRTQLNALSQIRLSEKRGLVDALTGIPNRRSFDQQFSSEWNLAIRTGGNIGLIMADIDKFKLFNDTYGHMNGDVVLKAVAKEMQQSLMRKSDIVFRWGGEEFVILLPGTDTIGVRTVAENIRRAIMSRNIDLLEGGKVKVTASLGAGSISPINAESLNIFLVEVDDALYRAKERGRNLVELIHENT